MEQIQQINEKNFPALNEETGEQMKKAIQEARSQNDSLGGILETAIVGLEPGIGEPFFGSLESRLASALFSVPALKGISFGSGFSFAQLKGSQANDAFSIQDEKIVTKTNHNGGINGGISNGMPVLFHTVIKPTPSISQKQNTVNFQTKTNTTIEIHGRHDPAIIHRARAVVDALTALTLADMLASHYGRQWLKEGNR